MNKKYEQSKLHQKKNELHKKLNSLNSQIDTVRGMNKYFVKPRNPTISLDEDLILAKKLSDIISSYRSRIYELRILLDNLKIESQEIDKIYCTEVSDLEKIKRYKCPTCDSKLTIEQSLKRIDLQRGVFTIEKHKVDIDNEISKLEEKLAYYRSKEIETVNEYEQVLTIANNKNQDSILNQYIEERASAISATNYSLIVEGIENQINNIKYEIKKIDKQLSIPN